METITIFRKSSDVLNSPINNPQSYELSIGTVVQFHSMCGLVKGRIIGINSSQSIIVDAFYVSGSVLYELGIQIITERQVLYVHSGNYNSVYDFYLSTNY